MEEKKITEKLDYKAMHRKYHTPYKNVHWDLLSKSCGDKSIKEQMKKDNKEFKEKNHMSLYPFMADVFDIAEEDRAEPNSRTPFSADIKVIKDVVYKSVDGQDLVMDLYFPAEEKDKYPVVMDIPGGGWVIHNRPRRDGYARLYATMGAVVAVIDHRLCPGVFFPDNLIDCIDAYNFLCDNAEKYKLDINDITVTGDSSGGHLTACLGCAASSKEYVEKLGLPELKSKPTNLIFISGAFSFEVMYRIPLTHTLMVRYFSGQPSRKAFREWKFYKESMPYNYLNKDYPESYNAGGMTDLLCLGEAKRMAKKLDEAGVKNEYKVGKNIFNSSHCYILRLPFAPARRDMLLLCKWFADKHAERGVDMSAGYQKIVDFLTDYKNAVRKEI